MASLAKTTLFGLYKYSGAMHAQERLAYWSGKRHMTVVVFHRVTDAIPADGLTVTTAWFRDFCAMMRDRFHVVPLAKIHEILQTGATPPMRTVAITFDDCYRDNLFAARVLAAHDLPATFFIPTQYIGTDLVCPWDVGLKKMPNLTWNDLKEMQSLGHEIGSHTVTHPDLGAIGIDEIRSELAESKRILQDGLGRPVRYFAYPFGGKNNCPIASLSTARELGYQACFSCHGGFVKPNMRGQILPREAMPYFRSLMHLELHLSGCLDWLYQLKRRVGLISTH